MNNNIKNFLKSLHVYYSLQAFYRRLVFLLRRAWLRKAYEKYKGGFYTCNYCNNNYSKFVPWYPNNKDSHAIATNAVIAGYGENIICPFCLSTARERLMKAVINTSINIKNKNILHLSPEKNVYVFINELATVTTADYHPGFYRTIDPRVKHEDATKLSFGDSLFDMVIANHIMEHISDDLSAMKEIFRVLKPGGIAILQVPYSTAIPCTLEEPNINDPPRQSYLFGQDDHVRIYALKDYLKRLETAGFLVQFTTYESMQPFYQFAIQQNEGFLEITKKVD